MIENVNISLIIITIMKLCCYSRKIKRHCVIQFTKYHENYYRFVLEVIKGSII